MISMTGYAYCENCAADLTVSVEIKSYNSRFLEIFVNLPPFLSTLETKVKTLITSACGRGKIEVYIKIREQNVPVTVNVNANAAKSYYNAINNAANELGLSEKPSLISILGMEGVLEIEKNRDEDRYWQAIEPLLKNALETFCAERQREGKHTEEDILQNLEKLETSVKTVSSYAPVLENNIKENIKSRFSELLGNQVDENRVLAETALLLIKYTISEELSRLNSHLNEFKSAVKNDPRPGKKLDFLSQEINREINTIGSKSAIIEVSTEVVKMKEALENIKEQLRNVE